MINVSEADQLISVSIPAYELKIEFIFPEPQIIFKKNVWSGKHAWVKVPFG